MKFAMVHENYNVLDLERSLEFYEKALGLTEKHRKEPYNLGDLEFHLAFRVDDFEAAHQLHEEMGCIVYENTGMGIYFITDPDGYWLEIIPTRKKDN